MEKRTIEEYQSRILRLKPVILTSPPILENMNRIFESVKMYRRDTSFLDSYLGSGMSHSIFHIGEVIDPQNQRLIHLALRINHDHPYEYYLEPKDGYELEEQLGSFNAAFLDQSYEVPYFVGAVISKLGDQTSRVAGIITEDVSENKKFSFDNVLDSSSATRSDGKIFYLDPDYNANSLGGEFYLKDEARIDLV